MPHTKTSLVCERCGKPIYTDEAFHTGKHVYHERSCKCIMKPHQCKIYEQPKEFKKTFHFNYVETEQKRKAGFHFAYDGGQE